MVFVFQLAGDICQIQTWRVIIQRVRVRPAACDATLIGFVHLAAIYFAVFDTPYLEFATFNWRISSGDIYINQDILYL